MNEDIEKQLLDSINTQLARLAYQFEEVDTTVTGFFVTIK